MVRRLLAAACVLAVAACTGESEPPPGHWQEPATPPAPTTPATPPEITLAFAGDVHFTGRTRSLLDDPATAIGPFAPVLREADFAMLNLESAVTDRGTPEPKTYHFRAPATAYDALAAAGIDVISLANNHALDYGQVGLADTLESAEAAGMPYVGAGGDTGEAHAPYLTTVAGTRLAVLGFSQVHELAESWVATGSRPGIAMAHDVERAADAVAGASDDADLVIVYVHWGQEGNPCPTDEMRSFATAMVDAGADIVLGTHAHVLLTGGRLDGAYVHWGLGNFVWYGDSHSTDTGVLLLTVQGDEVLAAEFRPGVVSGTGQPEPVDGADRERLEQRLASAADCAGLDPVTD
jgi:poly-gamma-glutamate capsule biosynthesis protein CapA/YwtB (metallophosphatase superfamily)